LLNQAFDGFANISLNQYQIGYSDLVMRVDVPCKRSQCAVGHANHEFRHVLEGIRHRQ
jgi:hypothetical protein